MKMLITGTTGFVGRNLKEYFQARSYDLFCPKRLELNLLDSDAVYAYLEKHKFDVVIHCGVTLDSVEKNLMMYFNFERCSRFFGKMICVGSGAEYDMRHYVPKMKETYYGTYIPADIYGFSKYVIAKDIEACRRNIINLRGFGIYGKYEDYKRRFISNNICRALSGEDISINKNMYFDYLYVTDFARIAEMFVNKDPRERSYNICTGEPVDLCSYARIIKDISGGNVNITVKEDGLKPEYSGDNSLFLSEYGKFDFTPHRDAIRELYQWYKDGIGEIFDPKEFRKTV
ncbi:MAG TPA: NAD-dependent epimerase/dehydratase family protein [Candidatus Omnitrophota bacterium]|nr:NAD-dependent epimerase/dehydratase family protein [Candidatus Omnitrophota bacterium]